MALKLYLEGEALALTKQRRMRMRKMRLKWLDPSKVWMGRMVCSRQGEQPRGLGQGTVLSTHNQRTSLSWWTGRLKNSCVWGSSGHCFFLCDP